MGVAALAAVGAPPFTAAATAATPDDTAVAVERAASVSSTDALDGSVLAGILGIDFAIATPDGAIPGGATSGGTTPGGATSDAKSVAAMPGGATSSAPAAAPTVPTTLVAPAVPTAPAPTSASVPPATTWEPVPSGSAPAATASGPPAAAEPDSSFAPVLAAEFRSYLATRPGAVSVALYDPATGMTVDVTNSTRTGWETASTVKLDILTALLSKTGESGQLTAGQLRLAKPMISISDNASASTLWRAAGAQSGMNGFFRGLGMTSTTAGGGGAWGLTRTTAYDQLRVLRAVAYPGSGLSANAMATAAGLLDTVIPSQRWGLTAGVPAGVSVEIKNGWLPYGGGWVINSLAHVHGAGKDYVMAAYTRDSRTMATGIETISGLSRLAWRYVPGAPDPKALAAPDPIALAAP
ncbi:serine hydrolase [Pseudofrankia asymbiotica]|uniref:serine hydrolase n=1 Tax=Pseudofrankia asymbiotica TaxID=1834516 RepID=UPI001F529AE0|nr:serine hydrolase [Pseudofrankia asymbiotica]